MQRRSLFAVETIWMKCQSLVNKEIILPTTHFSLFSRRQLAIFSQNRICHFMQIVSIGDNLYDMSNPVFWEK